MMDFEDKHFSTRMPTASKIILLMSALILLAFVVFFIYLYKTTDDNQYLYFLLFPALFLVPKQNCYPKRDVWTRAGDL